MYTFNVYPYNHNSLIVEKILKIFGITNMKISSENSLMNEAVFVFLGTLSTADDLSLLL